jgi:hypothetical protein
MFYCLDGLNHGKKMSFSSKTVSSETDEVNFDEKNI